MNIIKREAWTIGAIMAVVAAVLIGSFSVAHANPSFFAPQSMTATATSSLVYLTPGVSTTTIVYDSYNLNGTNQQTVSDPTTATAASLVLQLTGSTTPVITTSYSTTTYNIAFEYSQDGVDWYSDTLLPTASSTLSITGLSPLAYTFKLASATLGGTPIATTTPTTKILSVPTPTRFTRAVISIVAGSTNGAVWAAFIPRKEGK